MPAQNSNNCYDLLTEDLIKSALIKQFGSDVQLILYEVKEFAKPGDNFASAVTSVKVKTYRVAKINSDYLVFRN